MPPSYAGASKRVELVKMCEARGLPTGGAIAVLATRLEEYDKANFGDGSSDDEEAVDDDSSADGASIEDRKREALLKVKERKRANRKAANAAAKADVEDQTAGDGAGTPRKVADLIALGDDLLQTGATANSRSQAQLVSAEWFESKGKLPRLKVQKNDRLEMECSVPGCVGGVSWQRSSESSNFKCTVLKHHSCGGTVTPISIAHGSTAYNSEHLAGLVNEAVFDDPRVKGKHLRNLLQPFIKRKVLPSLVATMRRVAMVKMFGKPDEEITQLPGIAAALERKGHCVEIEYWDHEDLHDDYLQRLKNDHLIGQKNTPKRDRQAFDAELAKSLIPHVDEDAIYFKRCSFTPSTITDASDRFHPYTSSDFTSMKSQCGGSLGSRYFLDSNFCLVDGTHLIESGNETKEAWAALDEASVKNIPSIDSKDHVDVSDGFKGRNDVFDQTYSNAHLFADSKHRADAISKRPVSKGGGAVGKNHFLKAVHATTQSKLQKIKKEMPAAVAEHLGKVPDEEQFLAAALGQNRGKTTSSYVESGNNSVMAARMLHPTAALKNLARKIGDRWAAGKAAANACESTLPPRIMKKLLKTREAAARIPIDKIRFTSADKTIGTTPLLGKVNKAAAVNLNKMPEANKAACDRSCSVGTGMPCHHQIALADAAGLDFTDFMDERDTTEGWRAQYEGVEFMLPSEADYNDQEHLWNSKLCLVPPYKRNRGRPSMKRKKGFLEKKTKAKTVTCQRCWKKGHTKRWAGCPAR